MTKSSGSAMLPKLPRVFLFVLYAATIVLHLAEFVAAQPLVNASLMPLVAGVLGPSATDSSSIVNLQVINGWVFTTDGTSVYAQNLMDSNLTAPGKLPGPPYRDTPATTSITQLVKVNGVGILAIAGSQVLFYQCNATAAWRASSYSAAAGYSFDLISTNIPSGPLPYYPAQGSIPSTGARVVFLGTQRVVSPYSSSSTVYAMQVPSLIPAWSTTVPADITSHASWTDNATIVYIPSRNQSYYLKICALSLATGAVQRCDYSTSSYNVAFSVFGNLLVIAETYSVTVLNVTTGSYISSASPNGQNNVLPPTMVNGTIYVICSYYIVTVSPSSGAMSTNYIGYSVACGARNPTTGDVLLVTTNEQVYVINASGIVLATTLPQGQYSTGWCTGAVFDYIPGAPPSDMRNYLVYLTFTTSYYGGGVIVYDYKAGRVVGQLSTNQVSYGSVAIDRWSSNLLAVGLNDGRNIMQVFDPNANTAAQQSKWSYSYLAELSSSYNLQGSVINGSTVFVVAYYDLFSIDWRGVSTTLYSFSTSVSVEAGPWIVGQYLVVFDNYYNKLYRFDASNSYAVTMVSGLCDLAVNQDVVIVGSKIIFSCDEISQPAAFAFDLSVSALSAVELSSASSSATTAGVGVVYDPSSTYVIVPTKSTEVRAFSTTVSTFPVRWTTALGSIVSNPVVWNGFVYIIAYPATATSTTGPYIPTLYALETFFGVSLTIGPMYVNTDSYDKLLIIKSGGVFGGALLYVVGNQNITAYTTSMKVFFSYTAFNGTIYPRNSYSPRAAVLDNTGALAFYDSYGYFNVLNGFQGTLLWRYKISSSYATLLVPIVADNQSIYFNTGYDVVGADVFSGRTNTMVTYASTSYTLVSASFAMNSSGFTTIAAVKRYEVVLVQTINTTRSIRYSGGPQPRLPGAGSAPNTGATGFGAAAAGKGWVAAVVIGVLLVVAAGGYRAHRARQTAAAAAAVTAGGGYALMQPAPINAVATSYTPHQPQQQPMMMSYSPGGSPPPGQYPPPAGGMMMMPPPQQQQHQQPMMTMSYAPGGGAPPPQQQQPGMYNPNGYVPPPGAGYAAAPQQNYGDVAL